MTEDPRIEAVAETARQHTIKYGVGSWALPDAFYYDLARAALAAADAAAWRPMSEAGEHEQIIAYRCSWGGVNVSEGYPLKDGEWVVPGSAATVEPVACQPFPTPPQEQK